MLMRAADAFASRDSNVALQAASSDPPNLLNNWDLEEGVERASLVSILFFPGSAFVSSSLKLDPVPPP